MGADSGLAATELIPQPPPPSAGQDAAAGEVKSPAPLERPPYAGVIEASNQPCKLWRTMIWLDSAEYHLGNYGSRAETAAAHDLGLLWMDYHDVGEWVRGRDVRRMITLLKRTESGQTLRCR